MAAVISEHDKNEALRLARSISDYDRKDSATRQTGDNTRRLNRLTLGEFIVNHADDAMVLLTYLAENTSFTMSELQDYYMVAKWNAESGWDRWLRDEASMSFTINRTLAGRRVKVARGAGLRSVQDRIDALQDSIQRNDGVAKDDKEFRRALGILPPPNSLENILERAAGDPTFRQSLRDRGVVVLSAEADMTDDEYNRSRQRRALRDREQYLSELHSAKVWIERFANLVEDAQELESMVDDVGEIEPGLRQIILDGIQRITSILVPMQARVDGSLDAALRSMQAEA